MGLVSAVCYVESGHRLSVINHDDGGSDSIGVCQMKLTTARLLGYRGSARGLLNPKTNIHYSAKYLRHHMDRYGDSYKAVSAYNAGSFRLNAKGRPINRRYVAKVFKAWSEGR